MNLNFFIKGLIIGFSIAAAVGPIGILCIQRTLSKGRLYGFISGLGAATADATYGCIAAFGLTFISNMLISQKNTIKLVGGLFLLYLGIRIFISKPGEKSPKAKESGILGAYISTVFLTLTNPTTILSFIAVFAGLGIGSSNGNYLSALLMVLGVFTGSTLWWLILSTGIGLLSKRFSEIILKWANKVSGVIITIFGILAVISIF